MRTRAFFFFLLWVRESLNVIARLPNNKNTSLWTIYGLLRQRNSRLEGRRQNSTLQSELRWLHSVDEGRRPACAHKDVADNFFLHGFINAHSLREKGTFLRDCDLARSEGGRLRFGVVNLFPSTQNWIAILMQLFWKDTKGILTDSSTKSCYGRWWHGWDNVMFVILLRDVCMHSSQLKWLVAWWWMRQCTRTQTLSLHARQVTCRFLRERALSQFHSALPGRCSRGSPVTRTAAPVEVPLRRSNLSTCLQWTPSGAPPPPPPLHHK